MKRIFSLLLVVAMLFSLASCDGTNSDIKETNPGVSNNSGSLEGILDGITADYRTTTELLQNEWETVHTTIGDTYEGYSKNQQALLDWYDLVRSETTALYTITNDKIVAYYKLVADTVNHEDDEAIEDATDDIYDLVYEDCFDDLYDVVYDDLFDDIYDEYYDGVIDDAEDSMDFNDWLDIRSDFYGTWLDVRSEFYGSWLDARSDFYGTWLDIRSAFRRGDFDVDTVIAENAAAKEAENDDSVNKTTSPAEAEGGPSLDASPVDGVEHEFGDFKYIVLTDGTIEITKYTGNDNDVTISSSYDGYEVSRIGSSAFEGCTTIENIILWPDVIVIGEAAFKGCAKLEEFSIPSSCVMIGESAFESCSDLEDVIFWGGEVIGNRAFKDCTSLKDISIPSEVISIGESAFEGCLSLESVIIWGDDVSFGVNAFANCPKLGKLPDGAYNDSTDNTDTNNTSAGGIRPEFKATMDEYEAFFDKYVEFMIAYKEAEDVTGMMGEYSSMMMQYVETMEALEKIDKDTLSNEEALYYAEVMLRINQKLLQAA